MADKGDIKEFEFEIEKLENEGKTAMIMSINNKIESIIAVADTIKDNSVQAIGKMKQMGLEIYMITGDNKRTALEIAKQVGISNVLAEILPENKAEEIEKLKNKGKIVGMVGDGINDSPALAVQILEWQLAQELILPLKLQI